MPYIVLAALSATLFLWQLGNAPLIGLDEGLYAECSHEMLTNGNYVVPTQTGEPFLDKPPLVYWLQAASMGLFGVNSFGVRLPSALAGLALVAWAVFMGTRLFNRRAGLLAGFVLATSGLVVGLARLCLLDETFTLAISLALGSFILSYLGKWSKWGYLVLWAMAGLTMMIKGPAGPVLIFLTVTAFLLLRRQPRKLLHTMPVLGLLVFLVISLPWYMLVQRETGGAFLREFFVHQNIQRGMGMDFDHNQPLWFYLPIYLAGFFPWSVFIAMAWHDSVRLRPADQSQEAALFLAVSAITVLAGFSLLVSKLPHYILPAIPPSALMVGAAWSSAIESPKHPSIRRYAAVALVISLVIAAALLVGPGFLPKPIPGLLKALMPMGISLIAGSLISFIMLRKNNAWAGFAALCGGMVGFLVIAAVVGMPIATRSIAAPTSDIACHIKRAALKDEQIIAYRSYSSQPALSFYSGRMVRKIDDTELLRRTTRKPSLVVVKQANVCDLPIGAKLVFRSGPYRLYRFD